jgi:cobalt-zinc-cadmium efflux system outer membrane protein
MRRLAATGARQQALVNETRAAVWPDLTVEAGYRYFNATADSAVVLGLSLSLPLFDRNQGALAAARRRAAAAGFEVRAAHARLSTRLKQLHTELKAAHRQTKTLAVVLDQARAAHQAIKTGQALGRFGYLDLLAAQRSRFEVERRHLDALARYHLAAAALEDLLGAPLPVASASQRRRTDGERGSP